MRDPSPILVSVLLLFAACSAPTSDAGGEAGSVPAPAALDIELVQGTDTEARLARELRAALDERGLDRWVLTRRVRIDEETRIPHSHPVLTLNTSPLGDEHDLLSAFVHEQLHWLEDGRTLDAFRAAMADYSEIWPEVPAWAEGGARDERSTWRHLLINDLELQAMAAIIGEEDARAYLATIDHYEWIYDKVLNDPRVREIALRHGFDVRDGIPDSLRP